MHFRTSLGASLIVGLTLVALLGAGCPTTVSNGPSTSLAFGKLPIPSATASQTKTASDFASPALQNTEGTGAVFSGIATPASAPVGSSVKGMPIRVPPVPNPRANPVTVQYNIEGTLPTWGTTADVLQLSRTLPAPGIVSAFAQSAGLPAAAFSSNATLTSVNLQWTDADSFQWSFDAGNHQVSFWKNVPYADIYSNTQTQPSYDKTEMISLANMFLNAHGFAALTIGGGTIDDPLLTANGNEKSQTLIYPCPIMMGGSADSAGGAVAEGATSPTVVTTVAYPCGGWSQQVTVWYGGTRDGKQVVDTNGYPNRSTSVTINLQTKQVTSGSIQLDQSVQRSSYPLIDQATAQKRLESGGLSPVYPWGSEPENITVHLTSFDSVWLRYDSWADKRNTTYFIPALRASGTVDRGIKGQTPESYNEIVPLPADDVFQTQNVTTPPNPTPVPMMRGTLQIQGAPTVTSAPGSGPMNE